MPPEWDHCMTTTVAWAVGSQGKIFNLECEVYSLPIAFRSMQWVLYTATLCHLSHGVRCPSWPVRGCVST